MSNKNHIMWFDVMFFVLICIIWLVLYLIKYSSDFSTLLISVLGLGWMYKIDGGVV